MSDLAQRYGAPSRRSRRLLVTGVVVLAAVFLGWLGWVTVVHSTPEVTSQQTGFEIVDAHTAEATFTVARRTADVKATCLLKAYAEDHSVVGELDVVVGPGGPLRESVTKAVRTEREATGVELTGCTAPGQNQPR